MKKPKIKYVEFNEIAKKNDTKVEQHTEVIHGNIHINDLLKSADFVLRGWILSECEVVSPIKGGVTTILNYYRYTKK